MSALVNMWSAKAGAVCTKVGKREADRAVLLQGCVLHRRLTHIPGFSPPPITPHRPTHLHQRVEERRAERVVAEQRQRLEERLEADADSRGRSRRGGRLGPPGSSSRGGGGRVFHNRKGGAVGVREGSERRLGEAGAAVVREQQQEEGRPLSKGPRRGVLKPEMEMDGA